MTTRPNGKDICELFGYEPDDTSTSAHTNRETGYCPFLNDGCTKQVTEGPQGKRQKVTLGVCSVVNSKHQIEKTLVHDEEVIICPNRLYADNYKSLKICIADALKKTIPVYSKEQYDTLKNNALTQPSKVPAEFTVMLGQRSGKEVSLSKPNVLSLSLDWTFAHVKNGKLQTIIPAEVQSLDITGTYRRGNWEAYMQNQTSAPPSGHGMNWANVWKRLIPQLIIKGNIALKNSLCSKGTYFVVPERVFQQFEKIIGTGALPTQPKPDKGVMTVITFDLGPRVGPGQIRDLVQIRKVRYKIQDIAQAFGAGTNVASLGPMITTKVKKQLGL